MRRYFFFFSRRLILEKIPIGEWFEDEVWNAVQRFARPQKGASPDPGRPRRIRPRVKSSLFPRIGLVRDSKCLSLARCPSQKKSVCFVSPRHSLSQSTRNDPNSLRERSPTRNSFPLRTLGNLEPSKPAELTDPMKSVYGQWVQAWSPKLKQPSDDLRKKSYEQKRNRPRRRRAQKARWRHTRLGAINVVLLTA